MLSCARIIGPRWSPRQPLSVTRRFCIKLICSALSEPKVLAHLDEECADFLPWLERKARARITSKLYIGKSAHGRALFASKRIRRGECILTIPFRVHLASEKLLPEAKSLLGDEVGEQSKLAILLMAEQKIGQRSEWAPYINCLPRPGEMHSSIFWSETELDMIRLSSVYQETFDEKALIQKDFMKIKPALEYFPELSESITCNDYMHALAVVKSRAWQRTKHVSLIPFADFVNHDGSSKALVLNDDDEQLTEVEADRSYAPNEEVLISYGNFSNADLLLDFGFTLPYNVHDQVKIRMNIPHHDSLHAMKMEVLQDDHRRNIKDASGSEDSADSFIIKEVKSDKGKGKGLPQSLRAFARVLCCTSPQELSDLVMEATRNDGRLARRPLKDKRRELQAHEILLSHITQLIEEYNASIKSLGPVDDSPSFYKRFALPKQNAFNLLAGELRILKSASAWLQNYCATLLRQTSKLQS